MCTENQYKKTELEILVTVISENCYRFHFSMSQNLKLDEQSVIKGPWKLLEVGGSSLAYKDLVKTETTGFLLQIQ